MALTVIKNCYLGSKGSLIRCQEKTHSPLGLCVFNLTQKICQIQQVELSLVNKGAAESRFVFFLFCNCLSLLCGTHRLQYVMLPHFEKHGFHEDHIYSKVQNANKSDGGLGPP